MGRSLTRQLLLGNPKQDILIYSRDEIKQLEMIQDFPAKEYPNLDFMIGDIRDGDRLLEACAKRNLVINAAAMKHVVMAEKNAEECNKTNVGGTKNLTDACGRAGVTKCLHISTDKAIEPQGVYGKSKRESEDLILEANGRFECSFSVVRFGNILGSRASVSEIFKKMAKTGCLTLTDPKATRFGVKMSDAIGFLMTKIKEMKGGEIFTPKMKAFHVIDLAKVIAPTSKLDVVGLRPGDKLHEVILDDSGQYIYSNEAEIMDQNEIISALTVDGSDG